MDKSLILDRRSQLCDISLDHGGHNSFERGHCAMEVVAWLAGESHDDHPECVCPVIGEFVRNWNDGLPSNAERDRLLKPLLCEMIGTKASGAIEERRSLLALDWQIRTYLPAWLDLINLSTEAQTIRSLTPIGSIDTAELAAPFVRSAQEKASATESAAWSAAWSAARSAAESAAESAAWSAARSAAWSAARSAAESAAWSAAESAAESAARSAAWSALNPVVALLQESAIDLLKRMIAVK